MSIPTDGFMDITKGQPLPTKGLCKVWVSYHLFIVCKLTWFIEGHLLSKQANHG